MFTSGLCILLQLVKIDDTSLIIVQIFVSKDVFSVLRFMILKLLSCANGLKRFQDKEKLTTEGCWK